MWLTERVLIVKIFQLYNLTYHYRQVYGLRWLFLIYLVSLFLRLFWRLLRFLAYLGYGGERKGCMTPRCDS